MKPTEVLLTAAVEQIKSEDQKPERKKGLRERTRRRHNYRVDTADALETALETRMIKLDSLVPEEGERFAPTKASLSTLLVMRTLARRFNFAAIEREIERRLPEQKRNRQRSRGRRIHTAIENKIRPLGLTEG